MFIAGNLIISFAHLVNLGFTVLYWLILIRAVISWVNADPMNPIVQFLHRATDPILEPIRQRLPYRTIDISPVIAVVIIIFLQKFLVQTLFDIGWRLRY